MCRDRNERKSRRVCSIQNGGTSLQRLWGIQNRRNTFVYLTHEWERRLMSILDYLIDSEIDEDCTYDGEIDTYYE